MRRLPQAMPSPLPLALPMLPSRSFSSVNPNFPSPLNNNDEIIKSALRTFYSLDILHTLSPTMSKNPARESLLSLSHADKKLGPGARVTCPRPCSQRIPELPELRC